jgi:isopentenyldiphosphate isomerase
MEMIDLYNPDGTPCGRTASRDEVHRLGLWHKTVHIWVLTPEGELLLQKRSPEKESHPGLWDISAAGHITAGDTSLHAAVRELGEEIGMAAEETDLGFLFSLCQRCEDFTRPFIDREITDIYLLRRAVDPCRLAIDRHEVEAVRLIATGEFRQELSDHPERFTPHAEEYGKLLEIVG